jgi:very-short-patch-repair endonuclease
MDGTPFVFCECGCGQRTKLATVNHRARGWVRGQPQQYTPARAEAIRRASTGREVSSETREKQAAAHRGKPWSDAQRQARMSQSEERKRQIAATISGTLTGRKLPVEQRAAQSQRLKGNAMPAACMSALQQSHVQAKRIAALRAAFAARPKAPKKPRAAYGSAEWRAKIGAANRGKTRTPEQRAAMSAAGTLAASTRKDIRERHSRTVRNWWAALTEAQRASFLAKRGAGQKRWWLNATDEERTRRIAGTEKARAAAAIASKAKWHRLTSAERLERMQPMWVASQTANPSSIENTVANLLDALGISYRRQAFIGRHLVDFFVKSKRLIIECDGTYWHSLPGRKENDARRDAYFQSRGFTVLRLPEPIIRSGAALAVLTERLAG